LEEKHQKANIKQQIKFEYDNSYVQHIRLQSTISRLLDIANRLQLIMKYLCNYFSDTFQWLLGRKFSRIPLKLWQELRYAHCTPKQSKLLYTQPATL